MIGPNTANIQVCLRSELYGKYGFLDVTPLRGHASGDVVFDTYIAIILSPDAWKACQVGSLPDRAFDILAIECLQSS